MSIAASKEAVTALLDYIYDGQPEVPVQFGLELLQLADACGLPKLLGAIEAGILASLDSSVALQVLQEAHGLHSLRTVCEDKVAEEFEACSQHPDFGKLSAGSPPTVGLGWSIPCCGRLKVPWLYVCSVSDL